MISMTLYYLGHMISITLYYLSSIIGIICHHVICMLPFVNFAHYLTELLDL